MATLGIIQGPNSGYLHILRPLYEYVSAWARLDRLLDVIYVSRDLLKPAMLPEGTNYPLYPFQEAFVEVELKTWLIIDYIWFGKCAYDETGVVSVRVDADQSGFPFCNRPNLNSTGNIIDLQRLCTSN